MSSFKVLFVVGCFVMLAQAQVKVPLKHVVGPQELTGEDLEIAEKVLKDTLSKLQTAQYTIGKVNSAFHQEHSGELYTFKVDLVDESDATSECEAVIWSRLFLQKFVFVQCKGAPPVYEQHES